jgi:organic radical activating enzyme
MTFRSKHSEFPIKTATACIHKWSWSTVFLGSGTTTSCHRCDHQTLTLENFSDFHNLPKKLNDRRLMLEGKWPEPVNPADQTGCGYCRRVEDAGGFSDRMLQNSNGAILVPPELDTEANAVRVTPRILEVYFSNLCNLSCLYCGPHFSSRWEEENRRVGDFHVHNSPRFPNDSYLYYSQFDTESKANPQYEAMKEKLWEWLRVNGKYLHSLQILGGEPFYQPELDTLLKLIDDNPMPDLTLMMITNFMAPHEKLVSRLDQMEQLVEEGKLKKVCLTGSIDGWGKEQEFTRSGLRLSLWEKNFAFAIRKKFVDMAINCAINPLTLKTMPLLLGKIREWREIANINMSFMTVTYPTEMNPDIFGPGFFREDFEKILAAMPVFTAHDLGVKEHMRGIAKMLENRPRKPLELLKLRIFLDEMDKRRHQNWRSVLPWLAPELDPLELESFDLTEHSAWRLNRKTGREARP